MPEKYAKELICDYLAACRTYGNDVKAEYDWWIKYSPKFKIHHDTWEFCTQVFREIAEGKSFKKAIKNF